MWLGLQEATIPSAESLNILDFHFSDFGLPEDATTQATVRMFLDLSLVQDFNIDYKVTEPLRFHWSKPEIVNPISLSLNQNANQ